MKNKKFLLLMLIPLLTGCDFLTVNNQNNEEGMSNNNTGNNNSGNNEDNNNNNNNNNNNSGDSNKNETNDKEFLDFFNHESKVEIYIRISNQAVTKLKEYAEGEGNDNYEKNEMYHPSTVKITVNGKETTLEEAGIRMKGNLSRDTDFVDDTGHFDINHLCHFKLNFAQTFEDKSFYYTHDWTNNEMGRLSRDDRKYASMKKLDLKWNRNYDNTFTKEAYVLDAFRSEGVYSQHSNLVKLTLQSDSDSFTTTYMALESVDKRLLKNANENDYKGDLYKCTYTDKGKANLNGFNNNDIGIEGPYYRPIYDLKTNGTNNDFSKMKTFINEVKKTYKSDNLNGEQYYNNISNYLDVDNFLRFSALSWVFGLPDDLRNNYNNYYIYFNKNNKALFLSYDNDRCLGLKNGWDKDLKNVSWDSSEAIGSGGFNECPLILRFISGGSNNSHPVHQASKDKYHQYCLDYASKYLDVNKFQEFTNQFTYAPSKDISIAGPENDSFAIYANSKKATLN
ncbi:MAG: CotH kinase family protein [Clostridia bacterium]|nr:CotH kinase family protein [Clostridia bacterium]